MIRPVFTEIALFLAPFVVYAIYLVATKAALLTMTSWPPKVSRHPASQPVPRRGECGAREDICSGSMLEAYAAYSATVVQGTAPRSGHYLE